jgi:hypothetical protein
VQGGGFFFFRSEDATDERYLETRQRTGLGSDAPPPYRPPPTSRPEQGRPTAVVQHYPGFVRKKYQGRVLNKFLVTVLHGSFSIIDSQGGLDRTR